MGRLSMGVVVGCGVVGCGVVGFGLDAASMPMSAQFQSSSGVRLISKHVFLAPPAHFPVSLQ